MTKCRKCGANNWHLIEQIGALETWRCESCGQEESVHVYDPSTQPIMPENIEPVFQVFGRWASKPSKQEIAEIQSHFPALRNVPISAILRKAMERSDFELGRFTEAEIEIFVPMLQRLNLEITKKPIIFEKR